MAPGYWGVALNPDKVPFESQVVQTVPANLQAFYRLLESDGAQSLADSSGKGSSIPLTGPAAFSSVGTPRGLGGKIWTNPGGSAAAATGPVWFRNANALTLLSWFKTSAGGDLALICGDQNIYNPGDARRKCAFYLHNGQLTWMNFTAAGGYPFASTSQLYNDDQWHCAVATRAAAPGLAASKIYVDGAFVTSADSTGSWTSTPTSNLTIGMLELGYFFSGSMAAQAIWDYELTAQQVADLWAASA